MSINKGDFILITRSDYHSVRAGDICIVTGVDNEFPHGGVKAIKLTGMIPLFHFNDRFEKVTLTRLEKVIYGLKID